MSCITLSSMPDVSFPDISDLLAPVTELYSIPAYIRGTVSIPFPSLPSIPTTPMDDLSIPSVEATLSAGSMYVGMIPSLIASALEPLETLLGDLLDLIPDVPDIPFSFADVLPPFDPQSVIDNVVASGISIISDIPCVPELWPSTSIPSLNALEATQSMINEVSSGGLTFLQEKLDIVVGMLEDLELTVPTMPTIPTIPTMVEFLAMLPDSPSIQDVIDAIPSPFTSISIPDPIVPDVQISDFDVKYTIKSILCSMNAYVLELLTDFIASLPLIGSVLDLPTVSTIFGTISMPTICHDDL